MKDNKIYQTRCLCKKVEIKAQLKKGDNTCQAHACHCGMCRKWGGSSLLGSENLELVSLSGKEWVKVYDSSLWAERAFCSECGTHLFYRVKENAMIAFPVGLFDETDLTTQLVSQLSIDKKPDYYSFEQKTKNLTQKEVEELFS